MELLIFDDKNIEMHHYPFENKWSIRSSIFFDKDELKHILKPFQEGCENKPSYICSVNLTNTVIGDVNKLIISGSDLQDIRFFKGTIMPIFSEIRNIFLFEIEYERTTKF